MTAGRVGDAITDNGPRRALTIDDVRAHRRELAAIGERYGVRNIRVFGSVARGEAEYSSDLDLLVDVAPGHGLLALSAFATEVEDVLHVFTQVATVNGLKPRIRAHVAAEAVSL